MQYVRALELHLMTERLQPLTNITIFPTPHPAPSNYYSIITLSSTFLDSTYK